MSAEERVLAHLVESADLKRRVAAECLESILAAAALLTRAFREGGQLLLCGNGGSAADCQHLAAEFVSRLRIERPRRALPAIALTTDTSFLTAFANDCGYEGVFARQVEALGRPGDVLLGISTSGSAPNVLRALEAAGARRLHTIALVGERARPAADVVIAVPSAVTMYIQEAHLAIEHLLCELVEEGLFAEPG